MNNEFNIGDIVQINKSGCAYTTYSEMAEKMGLTEYVYGNAAHHRPPLNSDLRIVGAVQPNYNNYKAGVTLYGVESVFTGDQYIISNEYGNMTLVKPAPQQYTLDDLRNKYVRVGTPEYEVFMDACAGLGITWSDGTNCREILPSVYVGYDTAGLSYSSTSEVYSVVGFHKFIPKQSQPVVEDTPWTVYNNTLQVSDLTDEQAVELFVAWRKGGIIQYCVGDEWHDTTMPTWLNSPVYRIKSKSELELFVEKAVAVAKDANADGFASLVMAMYNAGCRFV